MGDGGEPAAGTRERRTSDTRTTDGDYRRMMTWVAIALVVSVIAALVIVYFVMRAYAQ